MLRASAQTEGQRLDVRVVRDGVTGAANSGIPHAALLVSFAEAFVARDAAELASLRGELIAALGADGCLEAAAAAANFQRMVRIADGTGIPLEATGPTYGLALGGDLVDELHLREFRSAANTAQSKIDISGIGRRILARLLRPIRPWLAVFLAGSTDRRSD